MPIERVLFRELLPGDYRKIEASANEDPDVGGGARDLRFNDDEFGPIVGEMLPQRRQVEREGTDTVYVGEVEYAPGATEELVWEPSYPTRPDGRFRRIHESPAFRVAPDFRDEAVIMLLIQLDDSPLRIHFVRESDLREERSGLDDRIASTVLACLDETNENRPTWATKGYIDFTGQNMEMYCHT